MFKKVMLLMVIVLLASCGGSKSRVKSNQSKLKVEISKNKKKSTKGKKTTVSRKPTYGNTTETLESTSKTIVTSGVVTDYIDAYKETAKYNMQKYGVPASITLAQGILESGAGAGNLSKRANNHFGIKCHNDWVGESVRHDDDAAQECFRKYNDPAESYRDHSLFLTTRKRYAGLFNLKKDDYKAWAKGLKAAGYATDPKYPDKLIGLIEKHQLYKYDSESLETSSKVIPENKPVVVTETPNIETPNTNTEDVTITADVNRGSTYKVVKGDTLYSISKSFNTTVEELKRKNGLSDNTISIGQLLKL